jgi:hypothetical protein
MTPALGIRRSWQPRMVTGGCRLASCATWRIASAQRSPTPVWQAVHDSVSHMGGWIEVFPLLWRGATVVLEKEFEATRFYDDLRRWRPTLIGAHVPGDRSLAAHPFRQDRSQGARRAVRARARPQIVSRLRSLWAERDQPRSGRVRQTSKPSAYRAGPSRETESGRSCPKRHRRRGRQLRSTRRASAARRSIRWTCRPETRPSPGRQCAAGLVPAER